MSLCKTARNELGLTQVRFAQWLGEQAGKHINQPQIAAYEAGTRNMGETYRRICAPFAASFAAREIANLNADADRYLEKIADIVDYSMS